MITLPGLIDPHVHMRDPGGTHKEDWDSGTCAALAGGFTTVLAMPNTQPPITDLGTFDQAARSAKNKARCDYGQYLGAGPDNFNWEKGLASNSAGLKMYLDQTFGPLRLDNMVFWLNHLKNWPKNYPVVAHAEGRTMAAIILLAGMADRPVHIAHVSTREEILIIRAAKENGYKVTCEVTPHHLFLTKEDVPHLGAGRAEVRPRLADKSDRDALWDNLDIIDCFATDHAPHTLDEKDSSTPPPGFPGLETALPLMSTAVFEGRLSWEDVVARMVHNPRKIFNLPEQVNTKVKFDPHTSYEIHASNLKSRCGWTPFEGWRVRGAVMEVVQRGKLAYRDGEVLAEPGDGQPARKMQS